MKFFPFSFEIVILQSTQKKKIITFTSLKGLIFWYLLSGILIIILGYLNDLLNPDPALWKLNPSWISWALLLWPMLFIVLFLLFLTPAIGIEGPSPPQIMGRIEFWELSIISCFVLALILSFTFSEIVCRFSRQMLRNED